MKHECCPGRGKGGIGDVSECLFERHCPDGRYGMYTPSFGIPDDIACGSLPKPGPDPDYPRLVAARPTPPPTPVPYSPGWWYPETPDVAPPAGDDIDWDQAAENVNRALALADAAQKCHDVSPPELGPEFRAGYYLCIAALMAFGELDPGSQAPL